MASSRRGQTLLKGHHLVNEGQTFDYREPGVARCSCGARSPRGLSIRARQRWHAEHKDSLR